MAFLAGEQGRQVVVVGDRVLSEHGPEWAVSWPIALSADGGAVACRLTHTKTNRGCVAVNGRKGAEFDAVGPPALSGGGKVVAYRAREGDRWFVVVGNERGPAYGFVSDPALSADGSVAAYAAERGGQWVLVVGGRETAVDRQPSSVFLSEDGRSVGYWCFERERDGSSRMQVVAGGKRGEAFALVGRPVLSPDGRTVAYAADDGDRLYVVVGDRKFEVVGRASDPVFSPDGKQVGYGARIGREIWWKVLDVP